MMPAPDPAATVGPPRRTVAIGPARDWPTWSWVGFNLARELAKYYSVATYAMDECPKADVVIAIKEPPGALPLEQWSSSRIIYFPCDYYLEYAELVADWYLPRYAAVVTQSEYLVALLRRFNPNTFFLLHDDKYVLPEIQPPRRSGFVLWVGFSRYLLFLRDWLAANPLPCGLVVLTDRPGDVTLPGRVQQLAWTHRRQNELMRLAQGALDVKGDDFNQTTKPLEKLDSFVASGIPVAANTSPAIAAHFRDLGLDIATTTDGSRWFSDRYYDETVRCAGVLRERMALPFLGQSVRNIIEGSL